MTVTSADVSKKFILVDSLLSAFVLTSILLTTFALTFLVFPLQNLRIHFFQTGIFTAAFLFGPLAGALVGGLSSAYTAFAVLYNPWIIGGNVILGLFAGYFYTKTHPMKAVLAAFLIQLPYLIITDLFLAHMSFQVLRKIVFLLFFENLVCGTIAMTITPFIKKLLLRQSVN